MRSLLDDGRVHVFDGAMGTLLYGRGVFVNVCYDELNLSRPELVQGIHAEYVAVGAEILETNTFGANPLKLSSYGLEARTEEINAVAARLAREAARGRASVAGAIGPLGIRIEPWGPTSLDEAMEYFRRQVVGLLEGGVDGFVLETFADLSEIACAVRAVRAESDLPIVAQMTVGQDGKTAYGTDAAQLAKGLADAGADVIGLNCSVGPAVMLDAIEDMAEATTLPLSAQPNAGLPRTVRDRKMYLASPEYMAEYARRMIDVGVRFVGGCCGTTPDHVQKMRDSVAALQPRHVVVTVPDRSPTSPSGLVDAVPLDARSAWGRKLARGEAVASVEIIPPHSWDAREVIEPARRLKVAGVDAVSVVESPRSRSRMGALSAALIIEREVGIETIVHYTCRDKNMLGMISDLLGAAAMGARNLLVVSGDPPTMGPYPDATVVFDIDSIGLTNVVQGLNRGIDPGGNSIGAPTEFVQGVAINHSAVDFEREVTRFQYKVEAGADFAITQPVFDAEALERFLDRTTESRIPVVAGIWPVVTLRSAEFLANEMPGVSVPIEIVERMRVADASGPEASLEEGVTIALEMIEATRTFVQGYHLTAPHRKVDVALRVLRESGVRVTA
ncbi:MAG: bifunctional homocysteine S-methyltransferase/methylenetetrahydrofolate reductase [Gemmatimonadetes bacterium]|nr:bifunctional homocysteine S-methyltransferase/methylenetetrahydrofolate reductase [Gemmatimonadota bacterium]MDA1104488.1 bifunctional homocysteine S-methyltransferase/methylenetetrahydrofolate reductase [Gemmatimonadota bacterium]